MTIDIKSIYLYYNDKKDENNVILKNCSVNGNVYKCDNYSFELYENKLLVNSNNNGMKYIKQYILNEETTSKLELNNCIFLTKIETIFFENINNKIKIVAREYTEKNEFLSEVNIELVITN